MTLSLASNCLVLMLSILPLEEIQSNKRSKFLFNGLLIPETPY